MADATKAWDHLVTITTSADTVSPEVTLPLRGVQTDVEVDPQQLEQFGFKVKRVFSLTVNDPTIISQVKPGMRALEDNTGESARLLWHKRDFLGVTLYFGSTNQ